MGPGKVCICIPGRSKRLPINTCHGVLRGIGYRPDTIVLIHEEPCGPGYEKERRDFSVLIGFLIGPLLSESQTCPASLLNEEAGCCTAQVPLAALSRFPEPPLHHSACSAICITVSAAVLSIMNSTRPKPLRKRKLKTTAMCMGIIRA